MKYHHLALVLVLALVVCDAIAEKPAKKKKYRRVHLSKVKPSTEDPTELLSNEDDVIQLMEKDEDFDKAKELERENARARQAAEAPAEQNLAENRVEIPDLCAKVHCGAGRVCQVTDDMETECVCIQTCPVETEARRKVCSNHNETWPSDCSVYQQRCWCDRGDERCKGDLYKHVHIEYYGECRDMPECSDGEMADFPRRMRDWLFNIMRDLADRQELPAHYLKMEREAESNMTKRWANAAVWKWCDLDGHPHDRSVSRHELFPIRAPLMSLEHCIAPFLNSCDVDDNHRITLKEWAKCLEIDEDEVDDKCAEIDEEAAEHF